jgi:two-component system nitrogen regulation response regulator GlnG
MARMAKILVVDDEQTICWGIERLCNSLEHQVLIAASAEQGLRLAAESHPELLILDVRLPGMDGLTAMGEFRRFLGTAPIVVMTAFGDLDTAVKAVHNGAFEYVLKPFDLAEIRATIRRALMSYEAPSFVEPQQAVDGLLGKSPQMQDVFKRIALAAAADVSVLLEGESGVGKATAAKAIHRHSRRAAGPYITVNFSAHDAAQAEVELFGHAAGSNSEATFTQHGLLLEAQHGTLFLEDVAELPVAVQVKLLHVLETKELPSVVDEKPQKLDVRVISAVTGNLLDRVQMGGFRLELFHKLAEYQISLPALRERPGDIPLLARHFAAQRRGTKVNFAEETIVELTNRRWYGNVRELRSSIEHALVIARASLILADHLPPPLREIISSPDSTQSNASLTDLVKRRATDLLANPEAEGFVYEMFLEEIEPALLESAMDQFSQEYAPAARALGLHRTTLKRKLDQYKRTK